jgi:transposase
MSKLNFKKRMWIAKRYLNGVSAEKLALAQKINRSAVYQIINTYKEYGWDELIDV